MSKWVKGQGLATQELFLDSLVLLNSNFKNEKSLFIDVKMNLQICFSPPVSTLSFIKFDQSGISPWCPFLTETAKTLAGAMASITFAILELNSSLTEAGVKETA